MNQQLCDPNRLSSFVRGELSDEAERELTAHLNECESCARALEHQFAEASAWHEASVFLGERKAQDQDADFSVSDSRESLIQLLDELERVGLSWKLWIFRNSKLNNTTNQAVNLNALLVR